jgi:hypothetical protein
MRIITKKAQRPRRKRSGIATKTAIKAGAATAQPYAAGKYV